MSVAPLTKQHSTLAHLKFFFALSRTPHGLLDMATPALAALVWYGTLPPLSTTLLGIITAFAGYTAVYALNDLVDYKVDKVKLDQGGFQDTEGYLDAVLVRHPLAYGLLTYREGVVWAAGWALLALTGAYLLNPVCVVIFLAACMLEAVYCLMWRTSYLRTLVSGAVKTSGGMAAVFAVDPDPSLSFLSLLFLWLFFWEIGGQNIPADWTDIEEDRSLQATTIPVRFGPARASSIVLCSLVVAVGLSGVVSTLSRGGAHFAGTAAIIAAGIYLLLAPGWQLYKTKERVQASALFNRASYYPLVLLLVTIGRIIT